MSVTATAIPVFDYVEQYTLIEEEILDAVRSVLHCGSFVLGPKVHAFEEHFACFLGVDGYAVGVGNGTDALAVVEDCAQSCGTTWQGQMTGTFGDVGCFSFYPTKNLGAFGDGGLCFTRNKELAGAMHQIRRCGPTYDCQREGVNSRLDELQAAMLDVKLRYLGDYLAKRRAVAAVYQEHLLPSVARPRIATGADPSYHLLVVVVDRRDELIARLKAEEIGFGIHYPTPIHRMRGYSFLGYGEGSLSVTERLAKRVLSLPCYPELSHEAVRRVCSVVNDVAPPQA